MRNYDDDIDAWWWYRMMHRGPGWVARGAVTCPLRWCTRQNWCSLHFYTFISWILHPTLYNLELTLQPRVYCNQDGSMYSTWCTAFQLIHCKGSCILCTWLHCSRTCNCDIGQLGISRLWEEGGGGTDKLREKKLTHSLHCASLLPPHPTALINVQRKIDHTLRQKFLHIMSLCCIDCRGVLHVQKCNCSFTRRVKKGADAKNHLQLEKGNAWMLQILPLWQKWHMICGRAGSQGGSNKKTPRWGYRTLAPPDISPH